MLRKWKKNKNIEWESENARNDNLRFENENRRLCLESKKERWTGTGSSTNN